MNLVPPLIQSHRHGADEWLHTCGTLIVTRTEPPSDVFIIKYLNLECEILLKILNDHDEEWQFDSESLVCIGRASDIVS